jgi:uncharacterized protein
MNLIFDTNILISALVFEGQIEKMLILCLENPDIKFYVSEDVINEYNNKLSYQNLNKIMNKTTRQITKLEIAKFHQLISEVFIISSVSEKVNICRYPNDNMFLELAKAVSANYIITGDKDLLIIKKFEKTLILNPKEFMLNYSKNYLY